MIQVTGYIEQHGNMFLGWTDSFIGIAAQGKTEKEVMSKLLLLIRIKIAFDYKLPLLSVNAKTLPEDFDLSKVSWKENGSFELQL
ncbi:MAG: hypothetical protein DWP94_05285 [Flavobacterium sp.]|nr:MAG: hypothetical protein DWP94_05285 [Flavobacterium sp.]